jgi:hypothetical protein
MLRELGVEDHVIPVFAEQIRKSVENGQIKDNVELTKNVVAMLQNPKLQIPTIPGTTAHQLQTASQDPNFGGIKIGQQQESQ